MAQSIRKVGVIGAGQMGNGIAHVCALAGIPVVLNDIVPAAPEGGAGDHQRQHDAPGQPQAHHRGRQAGGAQAHRAPSRRYDGLSDCDLVIEAATEKEDVKRKIFTDLCPSLKPEAIVASNTSSISITRLASSTDRPEKFIGIHFMNPVPLMELVELIRGIATADADLRGVEGVRHQARQDHRGGRGLPGLHRQPHPAADDQRGDLHAVRRRRQRRGASTPPCGSARIIRWGRWSWPTSSASTLACR